MRKVIILIVILVLAVFAIPITASPNLQVGTPTSVFAPVQIILNTGAGTPTVVIPHSSLTVETRVGGVLTDGIPVTFRACTVSGSSTCPSYGLPTSMRSANAYGNPGIINIPALSWDYWYDVCATTCQDFYIPVGQDHVYIGFSQ